jgi:hypothetical protein
VRKRPKPDTALQEMVEACIARMRSGVPFTEADSVDTPNPEIVLKAHRRQGFQRFNYWNDERINPNFRSARDQAKDTAKVSSDYGQQYASYPAPNGAGHTWLHAYLVADLSALRSSWVIEQFERWALAGEHHQILTAMRHWMGAHGKSKSRPAVLAPMVFRDQWTYRTLLRLTTPTAEPRATRPRIQLKGAIAEVCQGRRGRFQRRFGMRITASSVKLVWQRYEAQYERWTAERPAVPARCSRAAFVRDLAHMQRNLARLAESQ